MKISINPAYNKSISQKSDLFSTISIKAPVITSDYHSDDKIKISRLGTDLSRIKPNKTSQLASIDVFKGDRLLKMVGQSTLKIEDTMGRMSGLTKIAQDVYDNLKMTHLGVS